jgi:hypothetical protein
MRRVVQRDRIGSWEVSRLAVRCCVSGTVRIGKVRSLGRPKNAPRAFVRLRRGVKRGRSGGATARGYAIEPHQRKTNHSLLSRT